MSVSVDIMVKVYTRVRDKRAELKAAFDEEDKALQAQLDKVKQGLLEYCKEHGVESVRTAHGLFYRTVKTRYWTNDWESFYGFMREHGTMELLEKRIHQMNMKEFMEQNPDAHPPGLNIDSEYEITIRRK
jgi:hypothetical protein